MHRRRVRPAADGTVCCRANLLRLAMCRRNERLAKLRIVRTRVQPGARLFERKLPSIVRRRAHALCVGLRRHVDRFAQLRRVRESVSRTVDMQRWSVRLSPRREAVWHCMRGSIKRSDQLWHVRQRVHGFDALLPNRSVRRQLHHSVHGVR